MSEEQPAAQEELVDPARLGAYLADLPALRDALPLRAVERVGQGQSNLTYRVLLAGGVVILRRPPPGPLPPSAHDVLREHRVMRGLAGSAVPVPRPIAACDDPSVIGAPFFLMEALPGEAIFFELPPALATAPIEVRRSIGAPFYVMEQVEGHVVTNEVPGALDTVEDRRRMGEELVDALVEIHAVDWQAVGLEGYGKPTGYTERQVRRFTGLWEHNRTREIPQVEKVGSWLSSNLPESPAATIVHGDFRLGNVMFEPQAPARLNAVFDWEMSTIGDPLADLGYLCTLWVSRDDPSLGMFELNGVTRQEGFPLREELIARYEERSGRSMTDIRWYQTLALWKSVVFMEGNYKRAVSGTTDDPFLKDFGAGVIQLADRAERTAFG